MGKKNALKLQPRLFIVSNCECNGVGFRGEEDEVGEKLLELVETSVTNEDRVSMADTRRGKFLFHLAVKKKKKKKK